MIGLVYSVNDPAGKGIAEYIIEMLKPDKTDKCINAETCYIGDNYILAGFREDTIEFEFLDHRLPENISMYVVLSRHSSAKKIKSYTVHHTGNFGPEAPFGGKPRSLSIANPRASHKQLILLKKYAEQYGRVKEYDVSYEATHHGPTEVKKPLNFIEIGSSIDEWRDPVNHRVVGDTVIDFLREGVSSDCIVVIGFGGGHYPRKHTKMAFTRNYCYGHIMAKYALHHLSREIIGLMIEKTYPRPIKLVVEKKGTRREHRMIIEEYADENNIEIEYI